MALDASRRSGTTRNPRGATWSSLLNHRMRVRARDDLADMFVRRMGAIHKRASDRLDGDPAQTA
ncbi:hypothetical protein AAFM48_23945 [Burkholderia pseudomallei]